MEAGEKGKAIKLKRIPVEAREKGKPSAETYSNRGAKGRRETCQLKRIPMEAREEGKAVS
jgi:regulator of extracellular matrix RemA (YlzA/DUF370 family)